MRAPAVRLLLTAAASVLFFGSALCLAFAEDAHQDEEQPAPRVLNPADAEREAIQNLQRGERSARDSLSGAQRRAIESLRNSEGQALDGLRRGERLPDEVGGRPVPEPAYDVRIGGGEPRPKRQPAVQGPLPQPNIDRLNPYLSAGNYLMGAGAFSYFGPRYANFAGPGDNFSVLPPTSIGFVSDGMGGVTPAFGGAIMNNGLIQQGVGFAPNGLGGFTASPYIIPPVTPGPVNALGMPMSNYPYSNMPYSQPIGFTPISTGPGTFGIQPIYDTAANGAIPPDPAAERAALEATGLLAPAGAPRALDRPESNQQVSRAIKAFGDRRYREALRQLDMAAAASPLDGSIELLRAQTFFAQADFQQAAAALDRALATLPEKAWGTVLTDHSDYYQERSLYGRQLATLEGFVRRYPKDAAARYLLGYHLGFQGRAADAAREIEAAMNLGRRDPQTEELYTLFNEEAKRQAAEEAVRKAAEKTDANAEPVRFDSGQHEM